MPTPRTRKASPTSGEAARGEKNDTPKTIDFRGLTLTLPPVLPGTLYFDFAELEDNQSSPAAQVRLLRSLVGDDQVVAIREKIAADNVPFDEVDEVVLGLFNDIVASFGVAEGDSEASADS